MRRDSRQKIRKFLLPEEVDGRHSEVEL